MHVDGYIFPLGAISPRALTERRRQYAGDPQRAILSAAHQDKLPRAAEPQLIDTRTNRGGKYPASAWIREACPLCPLWHDKSQVWAATAWSIEALTDRRYLISINNDLHIHNAESIDGRSTSSRWADP